LVVLRSWLNELGENNPYEQAFLSLHERCKALFDGWLSSDDTDTDTKLNEMTSEAYQLVDAVYASLRIKRGLSPDMHGFNPDHIQSVMQYFGNCVQFKEEDYEWMQNAFRDPNQSAMALMAAGSLAKNLRECFSLDAFLALIDGIRAESEAVSEQCMAYVFTLLIQYDIRIDFFPQIQEAFIQAVEEVDAEGETAFEVLCAIVRSTEAKWRELTLKESDLVEQLPDEVRTLLALVGSQTESNIVTWMPKSEQEYMEGLVQLLPDTWLYEVLVAENKERESNMALVYLSVGRMDLLWGNPARAASYLVHALRKGSENPHDYLNYAHCLLLQGDRMMAYEYYCQARQMCKSSKDFFALFRPDRHDLVEHGVPVEQVYLIEDHLLKGDA
jgi:tetratricopeptide (TPR) repeat protein